MTETREQHERRMQDLGLKKEQESWDAMPATISPTRDEESRGPAPQQQVKVHHRDQKDQWIGFCIKRLLPFAVIAGFIVRALCTDPNMMRYNRSTDTYSVDPLRCLLTLPIFVIVWCLIAVWPDLMG